MAKTERLQRLSVGLKLENFLEAWEIGQEVNESQAGYSICSGNGTFEFVYISAVNFHQKLSNGKGRPTRDCWDHLQKHVLPGNMLPLAMSNQLLLMIRRNRRALDWECGMVELRNDATMEWSQAR